VHYRPQIQFAPQPTMLRIEIVQNVVNGFCDFIAQCILIFRCWIVWGKDIRVAIIPSFLAISFIATWIAPQGAIKIEQGLPVSNPWGNTLILTALASSMTVNAVVTGMIVFKILKVFWEFKPTSVERTLGSLGSTEGSKLRHIIFIIIESGMALFAIQLVRVVLSSLVAQPWLALSGPLYGMQLIIGIHEMFNGLAPTIILVRTSMRLSFDDEESFKEVVGSLSFNHNPARDPDSLTESLQVMGGSSLGSSMPHQERNEDICFDISPNDPNFSLGRVGSSTPSQEKSEDIDIISA